MKPKQPNLLQYMNFSKKNKSTNKAKYKTIMPNYIDSFSNKYPTYLQSSLNEDILLLKKKLKGYSKIHSHSSNNTNKNIEVNKKPQIASNISNISPISPINNYFLKKKNNIYINKDMKNNLMLTSINNNSSIIYTSKDKEKIANNKSSSFRGINSNINYNYNINKNINKNLNKNVNNIYNNNPYEKKIKFNNNNKENKKYSMTSVSSRKTSKEREKPKKQGDTNTMNKINFNGLFQNYNYNKGKFLNNNYINNKIINENAYIKNNHNNYNNNNNINKKLFVCDFNNVKKMKLLNDFLESYLKAPPSNNNRTTKNKYNNYNNSNVSSNINNTNVNSNKNISSTANTSLIKNNCFPSSSSNYSPNNEAEFFKTAKISPRSSYPKKNQEFIQSHRVNVKNKLQGNILSFYNNYKNNMNNNMMGNSSNINLDNNDMSSHMAKKKKSNMSVNMNITYNNKNFNMSNIGKNKNRSMINSDDIIDNNYNYNINKTNKSNSLNKIQNINFIENYNYNYNLINKNNTNNNNINNHNHNSSNNSFINIKKNENLIMNGNNILNNCKININNINYNNYNNSNNNNNNTNINYNNYNHIFNEKMNYLNNKKNSIEIQNNNKVQNNKISSQSQQELTQIKKNKNKNFTTNNSPINKNINIKNRISINNSQNSIKTNNNNNINSYSSKNSKKNNNNNNSIKAKETKKIKYEIKQKPKTKTNNNSLLFENKIYEILELKHNLQKNNSEIYISAEKNEKKSKDFSKNNEKNDKDKESINNNNYNNKNTISNLSSTTHDSNYYMEKCNSLSKYIRDYYRRYNKYPNTNLNFYLYGRLIGQGAFGKVNIGLNILSGRVVAIKSFNKKSLSTNGDNMKKILSETDLMKKLNHPNVTKILEMFEDDEYILIAMEYINGGNLFSFVKKRRKLSEKTAKFLFRQIILGIKHIHSKRIVHRDIKLENILIDLNNNIKICDFGIGRILKNEKQLLYDKCGTPMYMAPEILLSSKTKGYEGFPVDIWSSGISLYIMLSGTLPFNLKNNESSDMSEESNNNNIELQYSIINKEPKKIEKISDEARDLLKGLLNKNPRKRLTIEQILNHPWLIENNKKNFKNKKYHLFTKAEMIMLSKTYIDYRNSLIEDLKENFTISNLKLENKENPDKTKKLKNITTKSSLLAPYNTLIQNEESFSEEGDNPDEFDDLANPNIILENDILIINNKIKEFNLNYELNNNGECDNGMLINTKTETITTSVNNQSQISSRNENEDDIDDISDNDENEEHEKKTEKILEEIERIGYDRKYVMNCVKNNELCQASAIYYLMMNYKDI